MRNLHSIKEYSCTKLFLINFVGYGCPIFHEIGNAGEVNGLQIRGARGVPIHGETPLRLDNIGKKNAGCHLFKCHALYVHVHLSQV